jgi:hypothetical protein
MTVTDYLLPHSFPQLLQRLVVEMKCLRVAVTRLLGGHFDVPGCSRRTPLPHIVHQVMVEVDSHCELRMVVDPHFGFCMVVDFRFGRTG